MTTPEPNPRGPVDREPPRPPAPVEPTGTAKPVEPVEEYVPGGGTSPSPAVEPVGTPRGPDAGPTVSEKPARRSSATAATWVALILGAIVLILLLIFVIQNNTKASFTYFAATFDLPLGVAMLLAAIAGALVMALVGSVRIIQLSWRLRRMRKHETELRDLVNGR
ncbi:LapA family protein [Brachybacterium sp. AOP25-B2-12]|uniref:LapA family protein n=1 Tax=Brachybacterium sp. AOP25-B2-12 TaxID=3457710 RepID=UPI004034E917